MNWAHKTSLTQPLFIEVPVPSQESDQSFIYVLGVSVSTIFPIGLWNCSDIFLSHVFILHDENADESLADIPGFKLIPSFAAAAYNPFKSISKLIATNGIHHMFLGRDINFFKYGECYTSTM